MSDDFKVHVNKYGRKNYVFRWTDPDTGQRVVKSAKTTKKAEALKEAGRIEKQLRDRTYAPASKMLWSDFVLKYTVEVLPGKAKKTQCMYGTVFSTVERIVNPHRLCDLTPRHH